jgi:hypothetical protein
MHESRLLHPSSRRHVSTNSQFRGEVRARSTVHIGVRVRTFATLFNGCPFLPSSKAREPRTARPIGQSQERKIQTVVVHSLPTLLKLQENHLTMVTTIDIHMNKNQ